jgi:hypothetical protein
MLYMLSLIIAAMLLFMFWRTTFSMRRDRLLTQRSARRVRHRRPRT